MPRYRRRISMRKVLRKTHHWKYSSSERGGGERFINLLVYFDDEIIEWVTSTTIEATDD